MLSRKTFISFDDIFPQVKGLQVKNKREMIQLANKVATALRKESENLVRERENSTTSGFFSTFAK